MPFSLDFFFFEFPPAIMMMSNGEGGGGEEGQWWWQEYSPVLHVSWLEAAFQQWLHWWEGHRLISFQGQNWEESWFIQFWIDSCPRTWGFLQCEEVSSLNASVWLAVMNYTANLKRVAMPWKGKGAQWIECSAYPKTLYLPGTSKDLPTAQLNSQNDLEYSLYLHRWIIYWRKEPEVDPLL